MATARIMPKIESVEVITIDSTFTPSPQGVILSSGTPVEFVNNSGATINITFNANAPGPKLFDNITNLLNQNTSAQQQPQAVNGSVNYTITAVGGSTYGPFAIQVGGGPLYVQITYTAGAGFSTPDPAVIPVGGTLEMVNLDPHSYGVGWGGGNNPFSPALNQVGRAAGNSAHTSNVGAGTYTYTLTTDHNPAAGSGGGKIKVVSS